ncbi:unnamed protein product [Protopolystoma xenopodis]|uniref:Uncharacterized protein n=1 Tax=Protopolystoma xenopodis TaxID=117903 RepID=A0A448WG03_9PLAT|nr:unnamed protein product [Protopolystoma xenopodis]
MFRAITGLELIRLESAKTILDTPAAELLGAACSEHVCDDLIADEFGPCGSRVNLTQEVLALTQLKLRLERVYEVFAKTIG